jgi:hypothetical protein
MKKISSIIVIALFATAISQFFNDCALGQTADKPAYLMSVLVTDEDGITPVSGAEVMFKSADVLVGLGITGADGYFHTKLPEGTYDIYTFYPGESGKMNRTERKGFNFNSESSLKMILPKDQTR